AQVLSRALKVALLVGTLLALINHTHAVLDQTFSTRNLIQVLLSYLVPYCVSTYSSVSALRQSQPQSAE
ncbi:MAG: nitrate/nitrite transporter NrtS, partial [Pseudomonadota bacterium]